MTDIATYKIELDRLRKFIATNRAFNRVAREAGVSHSTVTSVLNGEWVNATVLEAAANVRKQIEKEQVEKIIPAIKAIKAWALWPLTWNQSTLVATYAVAHHRVGDRVVIRVADLEAYMESNRVASNREIELRAASVA